MPRYVAFLRAINVGGHTVKMDRLRALFEELKLRNVETFIASGNVLFDTTTKDLAALEAKVEKHLARALGYDVETFIRALDELPVVASAHPFTTFEQDGHSLYVAFVKPALGADTLASLRRIATEHDEFHVNGREAYWLCRTRMSDSKIANGAIQKALGAPTTMRNVTTVRKLAAKAASA